ncbi:MAG: sirohydrochlorin cobaltochelatase [Oceanospirillaceae bacterium]
MAELNLLKKRIEMSDIQSRRKIGIMICGHGSRDKDAEREFSRVAAGLKQRFPDVPIEYGFLEFSAPNIHMGLNKLVAQGVDDIYAVPGMLFAATHARNDIPSVLVNYQEQLENTDTKIHYGSELGLHPAMIEAFETRIYQSLEIDCAAPPASMHDTMLVVVGRGTSDTLANAEAAKLTRIVNEDMGFGWADTVYSGVTYPSVGVGLERLIKLGFKKIVVAPYFLFTGRLIKRIYAYVDHIAVLHPEIEFIKTPYLNDHEKVIDAFEVRLREIMVDQVVSSANETLMQSFERRLAAGEVEVHHHHAEFVDPEESADAETHSHDHDHSHSHSHERGHSHGDDHSHENEHSHEHGHSHGVYKHIDHPLGPRTMIGENLCCCFMSQFPQTILDEEADKINAATFSHH